MAAVSELVSGLDAELVRLGYQPSTLKWYRGYWRRLERWFAAQGVQEFSLDVAMAWVDEACGGFFAKEQAGTLKQTDVYVFRVAAMLDDFAVHGSVLRRYSRSVSKISAEHAEVLAGFGAWLRADGCAVSTVRAYGTVAGEFLAFTGEPRRAGRAGRRGDRRVRCDAGGLCAEDGGAQAVRGQVASAVRRRRRADRPGGAGDGPGGPDRPSRRGSRRSGTRPTSRRSWRRSIAVTRPGNAITRSCC